MPRPREPERLELLKLEVDTRLADLWTHLHDGELTVELVASLMRASYGRGYVDAMQDPNPGRWIREHGYSTPKRRTT